MVFGENNAVLRYSIRNLWEANPIQAGFQVDFEEREADPSKYTIGQKLHPAADMQQDMDGGNDGMPAPYDGAQMPGGMPPGMPGMGEPQGGPMPDEQLQNIQPGMQPPQTQPGMQESLMKTDDLDLFLDALLDESVDELTEAPFDWERQGNPYMNYGGFNNQRAPASIAAGGPAAIANWQQQARAVDQGYTNPMRQGIGTPPPRFDQGRPVGRYADAGMGAPGGGMAGPRGGGMAGPRGGGGGRGPAAGGAGGRTAPQGPNANIRSVQDRLNGMGYGLRPDGLMGPQTRNAIKDFQQKQGITNDGIWGKNTQGAYDRMNANNPALRPGSPMTDEQSSKLHMMGADARQNQPGGNTAQNIAGVYGAAQGAANAQNARGSNPAAALSGVTSNRGRALLNPANTNTNAQAATGTQGGYGARGQALLRGNPGGTVDLGGNPAAAVSGVTSNRGRALLNPANTNTNAQAATGTQGGYGARAQALLGPQGNPGGTVDLGGNPQAAVTGGGQVGVGRNAQLRTGNAGGGVVAPGSPAAAGAVPNTNAPSLGSRALDFGGKALNWVGRKMPYVGGALDAAEELRANPNDPGRAAASGVGTGTGMWQGGIRGATLGARLTPGGPVTKGIGGLVGGTLGAIGGSEAGKALTTGAYDAAKGAYNWATGGGQPEKQTPAATAQSQPPPANTAPPANNAAAAVQPETVKSQPTSESAMTWNDYMVLFESDNR